MKQPDGAGRVNVEYSRWNLKDDLSVTGCLTKYQFIYFGYILLFFLLHPELPCDYLRILFQNLIISHVDFWNVFLYKQISYQV